MCSFIDLGLFKKTIERAKKIIWDAVRGISGAVWVLVVQSIITFSVGLVILKELSFFRNTITKFSLLPVFSVKNSKILLIQPTEKSLLCERHDYSQKN
ncbi:hypothetical protein GCM10020331_097600 [Ectobacillus funiculus]